MATWTKESEDRFLLYAGNRVVAEVRYLGYSECFLAYLSGSHTTKSCTLKNKEEAKAWCELRLSKQAKNFIKRGKLIQKALKE